MKAIRVETWHIVDKKDAKLTDNPLMGLRVCLKHLGLWVPLHQSSNMTRYSQIPHNVLYSYANTQMRGVNWMRFFFKDEPIHKWQAEDDNEVDTSYYKNIEEYKNLHAEHFI